MSCGIIATSPIHTNNSFFVHYQEQLMLPNKIILGHTLALVKRCADILIK